MPSRTAPPPRAAASACALLALALLLSACATPTARSSLTASHPRSAVQAAVRALVTAGGAPGAAALAREGGEVRFAAAGVSDLRTDRRMRPGDRFRAGSVTKTLVATVVLQLVGERRLSPADPVERHLPGLVRGRGNDGRKITLRQLLNHTSGLFNYTDDPGLRSELSGPGFRTHHLDTRTPGELLRTALRHPPYFPPGTGFHYSNTDYILLGMIIERATGNPYAEEVKRRVLAPLGLRSTTFPGNRTGLPPPHGRAYSTSPPTTPKNTTSARTAPKNTTSTPAASKNTAPDRTAPNNTAKNATKDVTLLDPSSAGAAGEVISTLADLTRFTSALLSGELLPRAQLEEMRNTAGTGGSYGLGLFPVHLPCGETLWGHNGTINGSYVQTLTTSTGTHTLTYHLNTDTPPAKDPETRLLEAEFCRNPAPPEANPAPPALEERGPGQSPDSHKPSPSGA
ncbi:serine hydrolase domain-containing protein [Streptomyces pathocidini]|uniref:Serine hydrolase domain-containing protein n=2 Tax=Streptomyces pathocidini TaxID=1650571 RepID=A0ABW7UVW9_9ACTN